MQDNYPRKIHIIPENFALEGKAANGTSWRNIIEAAVIFIALLIPDIMFMPNTTYRIYGAVACIAPAIFAFVGINGLSLTEFLSDMIQYRATNNIYAKPTQDSILDREKQIIREKHRILKEEKAREKKDRKRNKKALKKKRSRSKNKNRNKGVMGIEKENL